MFHLELRKTLIMKCSKQNLSILKNKNLKIKENNKKRAKITARFLFAKFIIQQY